jgi:hypothetical protein
MDEGSHGSGKQLNSLVVLTTTDHLCVVPLSGSPQFVIFQDLPHVTCPACTCAACLGKSKDGSLVMTGS